MAQATADILKHTMETVRPTLKYLVEEEEFASQKVKRASEKHRIAKTTNSADFRAPFIWQTAGQPAIFSSAGGALGAGNGYKTDHFVQACKEFRVAVSVNQDVLSATKAKSIKNALKENLKQAGKTYRRAEDAMWHNLTGTQGALALGTTFDTVTYTCDTEFGANLWMVGWPVEVFAANLSTWKTSTLSAAGTLPTVAAINKKNRTLALSSVGSFDTAAAAGDYLLFQGVGSTPASQLGLYAFNNVAVTGTLLGVNRATIPEINSNFVDGSTGLSVELGYILKSQIRQRRGKVNKLTAFAHDTQRLAIHQLGLNASVWQRSAGDKTIDWMPKDDGEPLPFCGVMVHQDIHSSRKRIDFICLDSWVRIYHEEMDFYRRPDGGSYFFEGRNSSGGVTAVWHFYMWAFYNMMDCSGGSDGGMIYDLPIASGF